MPCSRKRSASVMSTSWLVMRRATTIARHSRRGSTTFITDVRLTARRYGARRAGDQAACPRAAAARGGQAQLPGTRRRTSKKRRGCRHWGSDSHKPKRGKRCAAGPLVHLAARTVKHRGRNRPHVHVETDERKLFHAAPPRNCGSATASAVATRENVRGGAPLRYIRSSLESARYNWRCHS
jgi:hypothetical protein